MIGRNDPCWCGSGNKWKKCHYPEKGRMAAADQEETKKKYYKKYNILIKDDKQIEGIRRSCRLAANILDEICAAAKEGVTTLELDNLAGKLHEEAGALPAPLNYGSPPFPKRICTSLNEVICHGIPDKRPLKEGDILNIDVTCILGSYFGDCSRMVSIGKISEEKQLVVDVSYESLMESLKVLKPGVMISRIGEVIESIAHPRGCSVVNQFVGHGVGVRFHEGPQVPHCRNNVNIPLQPGMTFTIEPMINAGAREAVIDPADGWTARTVDGRASAQWEHTLLITDEGCEILTPWKRNT